jgi:hypothetical protein
LIIRDRDALDKLFTTKRIGVYVGVDPTAPSIHLGHMLPFMVLAWAYVYGLKAVWLVRNIILYIFSHRSPFLLSPSLVTPGIVNSMADTWK